MQITSFPPPREICSISIYAKMNFHVHFYIYLRLKCHHYHTPILNKKSNFSPFVSILIVDWHCRMRSIKFRAVLDCNVVVFVVHYQATFHCLCRRTAMMLSEEVSISRGLKMLTRLRGKSASKAHSKLPEKADKKLGRWSF